LYVQANVEAAPGPSVTGPAGTGPATAAMPAGTPGSAGATLSASTCPAFVTVRTTVSHWPVTTATGATARAATSRAGASASVPADAEALSESDVTVPVNESAPAPLT